MEGTRGMLGGGKFRQELDSAMNAAKADTETRLQCVFAKTEAELLRMAWLSDPFSLLLPPSAGGQLAITGRLSHAQPGAKVQPRGQFHALFNLSVFSSSVGNMDK